MILLLYIDLKKMEVMFLVCHRWEATQKACTLGMITCDLECLGADCENSLYTFDQSEKS